MAKLYGSNSYALLLKIGLCFSILCVGVRQECGQLKSIEDVLGSYPQGILRQCSLRSSMKPRTLENVLSERGLDLDLIDLVGQMLKYNPNDRIQAQHAMGHRFFANLL